MGKIKKSDEQKKSLKRSKKITLHPHKSWDPKYYDSKNIRLVILEALIEGDIELLKSILVAKIHLSNKADLVRKTKLGRQTLYDLIDDKREFNPTIKTLSALLKAIAA